MLTPKSSSYDFFLCRNFKLLVNPFHQKLYSFLSTALPRSGVVTIWDTFPPQVEDVPLEPCSSSSLDKSFNKLRQEVEFPAFYSSITVWKRFRYENAKKKKNTLNWLVATVWILKKDMRKTAWSLSVKPQDLKHWSAPWQANLCNIYLLRVNSYVDAWRVSLVSIRTYFKKAAL